MGIAAKPRCAVVFLMILTMGVSLGLPAEDVLDAVYDESEALPYEGTPLFSIVVPPVAARTTRAVLSSYTLDLVLHPRFPLHLSATPMPIEPPIPESHWPCSVLCFASNLGYLASLKNRSAISRGSQQQKSR